MFEHITTNELNMRFDNHKQHEIFLIATQMRQDYFVFRKKYGYEPMTFHIYCQRHRLWGRMIELDDSIVSVYGEKEICIQRELKL